MSRDESSGQVFNLLYYYRASTGQASMEPMRLCRESRSSNRAGGAHHQYLPGRPLFSNSLRQRDAREQQRHPRLLDSTKGRLRMMDQAAETCRKEPQVLQEIVKGAELGTTECQYQFRNRRWNCTTARKSLRRVISRGIYNKYIKRKKNFHFILSRGYQRSRGRNCCAIITLLSSHCQSFTKRKEISLLLPL